MCAPSLTSSRSVSFMAACFAASSAANALMSASSCSNVRLRSSPEGLASPSSAEGTAELAPPPPPVAAAAASLAALAAFLCAFAIEDATAEAFAALMPAPPTRAMAFLIMGGISGPMPCRAPPARAFAPNRFTRVIPRSSWSLMSRFSIRESRRTGRSKAQETCVAALSDKIAPGTSRFAASINAVGSYGTNVASGRVFAICARVYDRGGRASVASFACQLCASLKTADISGRYPSGPAATSASRMTGDAILPSSTRAPMARVVGSIARGSRKTKRRPLLLPVRAKEVRSLSRVMAKRSGLA